MHSLEPGNDNKTTVLEGVNPIQAKGRHHLLDSAKFLWDTTQSETAGYKTLHRYQRKMSHSRHYWSCDFTSCGLRKLKHSYMLKCARPAESL